MLIYEDVARGGPDPCEPHCTMSGPKREDWMTGDGSFDALLSGKGRPAAAEKKAAQPAVSSRELNTQLTGKEPRKERPTETSLAWTKVLVQKSLDRVERGEATLRDVAEERFGSLEEFEEACRRVGLRMAAPENPPSRKASLKPEPAEADEAVGLADLNRLVARKIKAEMMGNYEEAQELGRRLSVSHAAARSPPPKRAAPRPEDLRRLEETEEGDSVRKMAEHERLAATSELDDELARRIGRSGRFADLEEFSERYGDAGTKRPRAADGEALRRRIAMGTIAKMARIEQNCWFCLDSERADKTLVAAYGDHTYLALPKHGQLDPLHCQIVPMEHALSTLQCNEAVWDEIRNFKKSLLQMAAVQGRRIVFLEASMGFGKCRHCRIDAVPLPAKPRVDPAGYYKKALLECDAEWSQHKKLFDTTAQSSGGLRRLVHKNFPYVYVDLRLDQGYAHVVEDEERVGADMLRDLTAGLLGLEGTEWKGRPLPEHALQAFARAYDRFDWTRQLHGEPGPH